MKKKDKKKWILDYMQDHPNVLADVCNEEFVLAYIDCCQPERVEDKGLFVPYIPELGRYLSELYKEGHVWRYAHGLQYTHDGWPKWIYVYVLKKKG